ncbi:diadenylate cyclase CdaA [Cytophagaceae bacterium DM2B3-1]|uniref:Diadenylate cyclase n=1 Tax=Xanthocytophaga flava TaxID=3048013 RepID=A0AAE3QXF3_9BACT|nr:diadenylate cyclase CdaA [Xanthocytophaga flavus]MDJ1485330.1 diadenylate cyclase CdaA [Xanthocytophaga flavus]MDJ1494594.1 diadenylate cyclase CdaA [Xanthocytophaga flavus]
MLGFAIGFLEITWVDALDIALVAFLLYQLYRLLKGSVAITIFLGFLSVYFFYLLVKAMEMKLLTEILGQFMGVGVIAVLILFQQEIRKFLLLIGQTTVFNNENIILNRLRQNLTIHRRMDIVPIVDAVKTLSSSQTGALLVFEQRADLKLYADSGDLLDAAISKRLLVSIFSKVSPLHDGAVLIANNRICAARCILPVSERQDIPARFGLRHRAAIGLTETTDALVVVVSEETGQISMVKSGNLMHNLSIQELRTQLNSHLFHNSEEAVEARVEGIGQGAA